MTNWPWLCPFRTVWPWKSDSASLSYRFPACEMGKERLLLVKEKLPGAQYMLNTELCLGSKGLSCSCTPNSHLEQRPPCQSSGPQVHRMYVVIIFGS